MKRKHLKEEEALNSDSDRSTSAPDLKFLNNNEITSKKLLSKLTKSDPRLFSKYLISLPKETVELISNRIQNASSKYMYKNDPVPSKLIKLQEKLGQMSPTPFSCSETFFKTILKYGMKNCDNCQNGALLLSILANVFALGSHIDSPVLGIQLMISHSRAPEIFLEPPEKYKKVPKIVEGDKGNSSTVVEENNEPESKNKELSGSYTLIKEELLKLWHLLVSSFSSSQKERSEENKKILEDSLPYLMQAYTATLSPCDQTIFKILQLYSSSPCNLALESMPLFGPKSWQKEDKINPLYAHSERANKILGFVNEKKAYHSSLLYVEKKEMSSSAFYDLRFLLPLLCHVLDEKNSCDGGRVVSFGWVYFIARGMSLENEVLRAEAFLAFQRLIDNFEKPKAARNKDSKIFLHFLLGIKRGVGELGVCRVTNVLSTWMVGAWEILKQPSHPLFSRLTNSLFGRTIVEMSIIPDFIPFYNDGDYTRESRIWILNILYHGLRDESDWAIARKLPVVKFLCSSFILEKLRTQRTILSILAHGASLPSIAAELCDKHSLPLWLSNLKLRSKSLRNEAKRLLNLLAPNYTLKEKESSEEGGKIETFGNSDIRRIFYEFACRKMEEMERKYGGGGENEEAENEIYYEENRKIGAEEEEHMDFE